MKTLRALTIAGALSFALALPIGAQAQAGGAPRADDPTASRATTFQAVEGPTQEDVPGGPLLVGAYGAILMLLLGYVMWLGRLQSVAARDVDRLRKTLAQAAEPAKKES